MKASKNKNLWIVPIYGIFYLIMFFVLENLPSTPHEIYSPLDDKIPFCEYFIVPYILWFVFMGATVVYFMFFNENGEEYRRIVSMLGTGMTIFLIVSFVFPNCHYLRPQVEGKNLFEKAVQLLHMVDTSTNLLPSIHVYNSLACFAAIARNDACKQRKGLVPATGILTLLIILSTMFLKQHSVIDVAAALILFCVCYYIFYHLIPEREELFAKVLAPNQIATIPNALSLFRLFLAIFFWGIGIRQYFPGKQALMVGTLAVSGITDFLDGWIARKYNMISEFGKMLDPIADKVTQGVLMLYLVNKYPLLQLTLILFFVKELSMFIASSRLLLETRKNDGAMWYGKISTTVFYVVMIVLVLFPKLEPGTANLLIWISSFFMALSFVLYMNYYITEYHRSKRERSCLL